MLFRSSSKSFADVPFVTNNREKVKCTYQEYLDDSGGNISALLKENFIVSWGNVWRLATSLKYLKESYTAQA